MSYPDSLSAGGRLVGGRYRLDEPLGRGGMGVVWRGRDELLGRAVSVKEVLLPPGLSGEEQGVLYRRTLREARAAARLDHPSVVMVYDVVEEDGRPWIIMELVRARSLGEILHEDGPFPPRRVAEVGGHVLAALQAAHAAGVLHRDVKPSNVLLADDGRVVLTDFGIATVEGDMTLTGSGTLLGSPAYIAPERARGGRATAASDLWGLGATLYAAVEGRPPHDRGAVLPTLTAVVTEEPDPPVKAGPLRPVLEGLLRKDPADRLVADDAVRLLDEVAAPLGAEAAPSGAGAPVRRPRAALMVAACAVVVAAGSVVGWMVLREDRGRPAQQAPGAANESPRGAVGPPEAVAVPSPTDQSPDPPDGFHRDRDPTGFSVAVPDGWRVSRDGSQVRFTEPGGGRFLLIDQTDDPKPDAVADWEQQEEARSETFPDYRRVRIAAVDYHLEAADWEFTYAGESGRIHVLNRGFVTAPDRAYAIYWSTPDSQWQDSLDYFDVFTDTFRPAT